MDKIYSLWFKSVPLKDDIKKELIGGFGDFEKIYQSSLEQYIKKGFNSIIYERVKAHTLNINELRHKIEICDKNKINIVDYIDERYPSYLRQIPDPPMVIYAKGDISLLEIPTIAIVGSRNCTEYGYSTTVKIASEIAQTGVTIISGMALGIDAAAHYGAMKTGNTIAVLGCGVDKCYPGSNYRIYEEILEKGCIISEYDMGEMPRPYYFPRRNRIISGMSSCIVVTEANIKSGSLITANLALEYGRDVCAIPGNVNRKLSLGTNNLIKNGAKCITSTDDIIEELPIDIRIKYEIIKKNNIKNDYELAQDERIVYAYVSWEPILLDEIVNSTQLSYIEIYEELSKLEVKGLIKKLPGERYVRV